MEEIIKHIKTLMQAIVLWEQVMPKIQTYS